MKFRKDFVTNSSSSSFVCDICGNVESGWDMSLQEAEMVECVNGHTICQDEMLSAPREVMLRLIQEEMQQSWSRFNGMTDTELNEKTDEELEEFLNQARSQIVNCRKMLQDASAEEDDL